jgi:hypothetical protein
MAQRTTEFANNWDDTSILATTATLTGAWIDVSQYKAWSLFISGLKVADSTDNVTLEFANGSVGPTKGSANGTVSLVADANGNAVYSPTPTAPQPWHWLRATKTAAATSPGAANVQLFGQRQ